jgi:hypothetical protein
MAKAQRALFHGGVAGLEIGGFILPPDETGRSGSGWFHRVYLTTDLLQAVFAARLVHDWSIWSGRSAALAPTTMAACGRTLPRGER